MNPTLQQLIEEIEKEKRGHETANLGCDAYCIDCQWYKAHSNTQDIIRSKMVNLPEDKVNE